MFYVYYSIYADGRHGGYMKNLKLEVRLTQYEMLQLEQEALRRDMTKSELIRSLIARFPEPLIQKDVTGLKSPARAKPPRKRWGFCASRHD
ncbi:hypothetical protein MiSe_43750 [Microseira wollei NIES-4236]|uniref:Ribbon-helix-helix protein CopG domain-containing protein n=1 Tax=Microseira wollei NIES-4236 TaxID=2530354 RepID=A0AAV3XBF3_9CYAN|nr:hypothetical protein MiSe_43750 [Microseira wollei NIES-4236]